MGAGPLSILPSMSSACLNLVEDDEGASFGYDPPRFELSGRNDARDVVAQLELFVHPGGLSSRFTYATFSSCTLPNSLGSHVFPT